MRPLLGAMLTHPEEIFKHAAFSPTGPPKNQDLACGRIVSGPHEDAMGSMLDPRGHSRFKDYCFGMLLRWFKKNIQKTTLLEGGWGGRQPFSLECGF